MSEIRIYTTYNKDKYKYKIYKDNEPLYENIGYNRNTPLRKELTSIINALMFIINKNIVIDKIYIFSKSKILAELITGKHYINNNIDLWNKYNNTIYDFSDKVFCGYHINNYIDF